MFTAIISILEKKKQSKIESKSKLNVHDIFFVINSTEFLASIPLVYNNWLFIIIIKVFK